MRGAEQREVMLGRERNAAQRLCVAELGNVRVEGEDEWEFDKDKRLCCS